MSCIITLPRFVVFSDMEGWLGAPLVYIVSSADDEKKGYILSSDDGENDIKKSDVKFEVVPATSGGGLVHIRSCLTDKYLRVESDSSSKSWIVAAADEPEEDQSNECCTLFEPRGTDSITDSVEVSLRTAYNNLPIASAPIPGEGVFGWVSSEYDDNPSSRTPTLGYRDWETLVFLPPHATFKGNNNNYLKPTDEGELKFSGTDPTDDELHGNTISNDINGFIYIKNNKSGKYWRAPADGGRIGVDSSDTYHHSKFWPEKIDENVYAIRSFLLEGACLYRDNDGYLRVDGSSPESSDVASEAQFTVEEQSIIIKEEDHSTLPRFVVFYLYSGVMPLLCSSEDDEKKGHIMQCEFPVLINKMFLREDYVPPPLPEDILRQLDVKFEVVPATSGSGGLVHIRSCLTDKYLRAQSESSRWIVAAADEPEEDQSKWCCTLFKPEHGYDDSLSLFNFNDLQVNFLKPLNDDEEYGDKAWQLCEPGDSCNSLLAYKDWEKLVFFPRRVIFKGDNGKYLLADEDELRFSGSDPADELAGYQIVPNSDGSISIMSNKSGKYWCAPRDDGRVVVDGDRSGDKDCSFWPIKIGSNVIALRTYRWDMDTYLCRGTSDDFLDSAARAIKGEAKFIVEEPVVSREIYDVTFRLSEAKIYGQDVITVDTKTAENDTREDDDSAELSFSYTDTKTATWNYRASLTLGVSTTLETGIPFIAGGKIEISAPVTTTAVNLSSPTETSTTVNPTYTVTVPAMTKVTVALVATKGTCEIPFSYTQRDLFFDGTTEITTNNDGLFHGTNCFGFQYNTTSTPVDEDKL